MKISKKEYLEAMDVVYNYKKQQKEYESSVKKNLNNKIFELGEYKPEDIMFNCDISVRLLRALNVLGFNNSSSLLEISKILSEKDFNSIRSVGLKTSTELIKILNSAGLKLKI